MMSTAAGFSRAVGITGLIGSLTADNGGSRRGAAFPTFQALESDTQFIGCRRGPLSFEIALQLMHAERGMALILIKQVERTQKPLALRVGKIPTGKRP